MQSSSISFSSVWWSCTIYFTRFLQSMTYAYFRMNIFQVLWKITSHNSLSYNYTRYICMLMVMRVNRLDFHPTVQLACKMEEANLPSRVNIAFLHTCPYCWQGGPQLKILACCMAKNLDIVRECMCAKREDPCGWGPRPAQGPWKLWDCRCSLMLYKP